MMRVIRSLKPVSAEMELRAWLSVAVRSCCYDRFRRETRRRRRELARSNQAAASGAGSHDDLVERTKWLHEQLMTLHPQQARLLTMRFRLGWTLQRIGEVLGLKPGAVDGRISRVLTHLRAQAREEFDD